MPTSGAQNLDQLTAHLDAEAERNDTATEHRTTPAADWLLGRYGRAMADVYREELDHLEHALSYVWPKWNDPITKNRVFAHLPVDQIRIVKWLLRRHRNITQGLGSHGVAIIQDAGGKVYALTVFDKRGARKANPSAFRTYVSPPKLALDCKVSLEEAEEAIADKPARYRGTYAQWLLERKKPTPLAEPPPAPAPVPAPPKAKAKAKANGGEA